MASDMFWNNNNNQLKQSASLKLKIVVTYGALFAISFCVIFCLVCGFWVSNTLDMVNQNIEELSRLYEYEYITGETLPAYYTATRRKRIDPEAITAVQAKLGEFSPTLVFRDTDSPGNMMMICLQTQRQNELYEVLVNPEKRISLHKITPTFTTESIQSVSRGPMHDQLFGVILDSGKNFPSYAKLSPALQEKLKNENFDRRSDLVIHYKTLSVNNEIYQVGYTYLFDGSLLIVGQNMHGNYEALVSLIVIFAITGGAVTLIGLLVGFLMAQKFTSGLKRIQDGARQIAAGDYTVRLKPGNDGREIDQLVASFNEMVIKTDFLLNEFKNISDNIAHDLKTPLTRILGRAELTVNGRQELVNYQETLSDIGEECNSMLSIINTMLQITKLESGVSPLNCQSFSLTKLGRQLLE
ncbi:MAG: HAMP domain-containing sensor histidine kinase, partial [Victivallaceae bacterium]